MRHNEKGLVQYFGSVLAVKEADNENKEILKELIKEIPRQASNKKQLTPAEQLNIIKSEYE